MKFAALSRPRRVPSLLLALAVLFCATLSPTVAAPLKPSRPTTSHDAFEFEGDESYTTLDYSHGSDRLEILYPTDRSLETLVWVNGWRFRLSSGFAADWLSSTVTPRDMATIRTIQQHLGDPLALSAELEERMARELLDRYPGMNFSRLDQCDPGLNATLFGAFGIGVIGTAVGCLTSWTGIGALVCGAGLVAVAGGVTALVLSDQGCNGDPPPEKPGPGDGDGSQGGDGDPPIDPPECPTDPLEPPDDECPAF